MCDSERDTKAAIEYFENIKNDCKDCKKEALENLNNGFFHHTPKDILTKIKSTPTQTLEKPSQDNLQSIDNGAKAFGLYDFQLHAARKLRERLDTYGVALLADPVGAGKTLTALAVASSFNSVRIITPPKLRAQWESYFDLDDELICNLKSRIHICTYYEAQTLELDKMEKNSYRDLIIIDESHNFRNGCPKGYTKGKENGYLKLKKNLHKNAKILLLSATPINNSFSDLANQLMLYRDVIITKDERLHPESICNKANKRLESAHRESTNISFDRDFYNLIRIIYARDSSEIEKAFKDESPLKAIPSIKINTERLSAVPSDIDFSFLNLLSKLGVNFNNSTQDRDTFIEFSIYNPYIFLDKNTRETLQDKKLENLGEYATSRGFIAMKLIKSLESSLDAFLATINKIIKYYDSYFNNKNILLEDAESCDEYDDYTFPKQLEALRDLQNSSDYFAELKASDFDKKVEKDLRILREIQDKIAKYESTNDFAKSAKFKKLCEIIDRLDSNIKEQKLLIFTESIITAKAITNALKTHYKGKLSIECINGDTDSNSFMAFKHRFSPKSSNYTLKDDEVPIDILVASDVISEGQNLQDCCNLVNWDIAFNPVRAIQRTGRIRRIGSSHKEVSITHFFPDIDLEKYIQIEDKLNRKIAAAEATTSTAQNPFSNKTKEDIKRLLEEKKRRYGELEDTEELCAFEDDSNTKSLISTLEFVLDELNIGQNNSFLPDGIFSIADNIQGFSKNSIVAFLSQDSKYYCVIYEIDSNTLKPSARSEDSGANLKRIFPLIIHDKLEPIKPFFEQLEKITNDYQDLSKLQTAFTHIQHLLDKQIKDIEKSYTGRNAGLIEEDEKSFKLIAWLFINPNFNTTFFKG